MNINERFDRLDQYIVEGRVLRRAWADTDADGRERACLLVALAPEVGRGKVDECPVSLLPPWLAHLTPALEDGVSEVAWPEVVREYARVVRLGATTLDDAGWRRVQARFLLATLAEAPSPEEEVVAALWRRVLAGDEPAEREWVTARSVAWKAAWPATRRAAVWAATWAAATAGVVGATCWDRMTTALLDAIEVECGAHRDREVKP